MTRCVLMMGVLLNAGVWTTSTQAQEFNLRAAKTLTVEQAASLKLKGDSLRFDKLAELPPEVAAALAKHKIELEFGSLASVSAETIKAFAGHNAGLSFPKLAELSPDQARILAGYEGSKLSLNGLATVSPELAKSLADYKGELHLNGAKELSADAAAALAGRKGAIHLDGLTSLTSIPLAEKLGGQNFMRLQALATISDDVARALFMSPDAKKGVELYLGLKELSLGTAKAMGERGRTVGAHFHMDGLESIPDEIAEALSCQAAIRCSKVTMLSDRAAKALNKFVHVHMYALSDVSNESLEMFSKRQTFVIHGLKKLDCVPFASTLMSNNSDFLDLNKLETISDEAADALAKDAIRSKRGVVPLPSLKSLNSVALAEVLAERKGHLALPKLDAAPDAVVRALAAHQGPLSLGLKSFSVEAAKAVAQRQDDTALGATKLSDEAAKELAQAKGKISLANLTEISDASSAALRANPKILLPKSIK